MSSETRDGTSLKPVNHKDRTHLNTTASTVQELLRILAMHEANTALLDVLVNNFVIILSFQNPTKSLFAQRSIDVKSAVRFKKMVY